VATALGLLVLLATPIIGACIFLGIRIHGMAARTRANPGRSPETTRLSQFRRARDRNWHNSSEVR